MKSPELERVAETHYMIRPTLTSALRRTVLSPDGQAFFPGCSNYLDVWTTRYSDRFFDMGTLIRAAASIETSLRDYFSQRKGYTNLSQLRQDPGYKKNIFQRIMPWHGNDGAIALMRTVGVDLSTLPNILAVQELVLHRHLYAHNLGVVDDEYIRRYKSLTSVDLLAHPIAVADFPAVDVVWLEPLSRVSAFIEAARSFLRALP